MDDIAVPNTRRRYYTPKEVALHNCAEDCWVSIFYKVYDLSELIEKNRGLLVQPIIRHAGEDLSKWFDEKTRNVKTHVDPERGIEVPFLPHGRFLDVPPSEPVANWSTNSSIPWWKNAALQIGLLTKKTRIVDVVNVLSQQTQPLEVCSEETISEIQDRYLQYNTHAASYTWKLLTDGEFVPLDMTLTLAENGVVDDSEELEELGINADNHRPIIHVYFNDDLTIM